VNFNVNWIATFRVHHIAYKTNRFGFIDLMAQANVALLLRAL